MSSIKSDWISARIRRDLITLPVILSPLARINRVSCELQWNRVPGVGEFAFAVVPFVHLI